MIIEIKTKIKPGCTLLFLTIFAVLATGCGASPFGLPTPTQKARQPFSTRAESENGAIVAWNGYTEGYQAGAEETFDITIKNESDQAWHGRYCLQLLDNQSPKVITTLEQREFSLEPGVGFSDSISAQFPDGLGEGAYGLSLVVRRPGGSMVDLVPIQVGETNETRRATTQQDMDAALEACALPSGTNPAAPLVTLAKADLAQRLGLRANQIEVKSVTPTEFPDTSLGVPEPGQGYAQVITPGYVIELSAVGQVYRYHASGERVVAVPGQESQMPGKPINTEYK